MGVSDPDRYIAERVRSSLKVFPEKFYDLSEGGELNNILTTTRTLRGPQVQQSPEDFTEQYLIEPVLHALGFSDPTSEKYESRGPHFVRRPTTFSKIEPMQPDYLLKNVSNKLICIVEAKAANREQKEGSKREATEDLKSYVESDTFCKYLLDRHGKYLIGIGTDGLRWTLWSKDLTTGIVEDEKKIVDLSPLVKAIAQDASIIRGVSEYTTPQVRDFLQSEFVPYFAAKNIESYVTGGLND